MPASIKDDLRAKGVHFEEISDLNEVMSELDIMYVTRIQKERFAVPEDYDKVKDMYILKKDMLVNVKKNFKVLHPLPRVNEINTDVDSTPYAYYFQQAKNGVIMRQAIITKLLNNR